MNDISIPSVPLSGAELQVHCDVILEVRPVILKWCERIYGENRYKQFRLEYFTGQLVKYKIGKKDRADLERLQPVEIALLQHNVRLCIKLARWYFRRSRHRMPGVEFQDFFQEAAMSVCDAVYGWNGDTKFVSYVHWAISNRLKDFIRCEHPLSPPSPDIVDLGNQVYEYMGRTGCRLETAIQELNIPVEQHDNVRRVSANVISQGSVERERHGVAQTLAEYAVDHRSTQVEGYDPAMLEALETAGLSDLEREVFDAYLLNEKSYQTRIADERGVTRQAISLAFQRAKTKLRATYFELAPSEASEDLEPEPPEPPEPSREVKRKKQAA